MNRALRRRPGLPLLVLIGLTVFATSSGSQNQNRPFDPGGQEAAPPLPAPPPQDPNQAPPPVQKPLPSPLTTVSFRATITPRASGSGAPRVLGELRWTCTMKTCEAQGPARLFGISSCTELADAVGPVRFFGAGDRSLSDADLGACNAGITTRSRPGLTPTSGGLGSRRVSPTPERGAPSLDELKRAAGSFREQAAKLPASFYTTSCPHPFAGGQLDEYLEASGRGDIEAARRSLWKMDTQLGCVSAARFAGLHAAFADTLLARAGADDASTLAPVVLLFLDYGGGPFRAAYLAWLRKHAAALIAALEQEDSALSRVGLMLQDRGSLVRLTGQPAQTLLSGASGSGLDSGRCSLLELENLGGDGDRTILFCPKDCQELLSDEEDAEGLLAGTPPPEVQAECQRRKDEKERLRASRGRGIGDCIQQFNTNSPGMLACQVEGLAGYRKTRLKISQPDYTTADIYAKRACLAGQRGGSDDLKKLFQAQMDAEYLYHQRERQYQRRDFLIQLIRREFDPDFEPGPVDWRAPPATSDCPGCDSSRREQHERLVRAFHDNESRIIESEGDLREALDRFQEYYDRLSAAQDCAADGTGCSNTCGIQDALAGIAEGCIDQTTAKPAPPKGGGGGPDPTVAGTGKPNPLAPGALPGSVSGLQECLAKATGSSGPQGDPACYDRTCPDGKVPDVDPKDPSRCTCVEPSERDPAVNFCPGYIDCPEDPKSACQCVALRDPGESIGGGGAPGRPPGMGPQRGPYRIPLP